jgi:hypothetical protein
MAMTTVRENSFSRVVHFFGTRLRAGKGKGGWFIGLVGIAAISVGVGIAQVQGQKGQDQAVNTASKPADTAAGSPNQAKDPNQPKDQGQSGDPNQPTNPTLQRQKQLEDDTAKLLVLANELKAEMDKSTKDTLSLSVIKKAEEIEKLARKVRGEMKTNSGN